MNFKESDLLQSTVLKQDAILCGCTVFAGLQYSSFHGDIIYFDLDM